MTIERGGRSTSPVHVHVDDQTPVHVHVKKPGKRSGKSIEVAPEDRLADTKSKSAYGASNLRRSTATARSRSKSPTGPWVPAPCKTTKGAKYSWQNLSDTWGLDPVYTKYGHWVYTAPPQRRARSVSPPPRRGASHRLEIAGNTHGASLHRSDLSTDEEDKNTGNMRQYEKKIDTLMSEVGTLKNEVELQRTAKELERREDELEVSRKFMEHQEKELEDCRRDLDDTEAENRLLRRSFDKSLHKSRSSERVCDRELLMKKLVEVEMDGQAAAKQAAALKDMTRRLKEDKRIGSSEATMMTKQKELLLDRIADFETSNRMLRNMLRDRHEQEAENLCLAEQRDLLLKKLSETEDNLQIAAQTDDQVIQELFKSIVEQRDLLVETLGVVNSETKRLRSGILDKDRTLSDFRAQTDAQREENMAMANLQASLENTRAHLQKQLRQKEGDCNRLAVQVRTLESHLAQEKIEVDHLSGLLGQAKEKADRDKEALKKATRVQKQRASRSEDAMEQLSAQLLERDTMLAEIRSELDNTRSHLDKLSKEKSQQHAENVALKTRLKELQEMEEIWKEHEKQKSRELEELKEREQVREIERRQDIEKLKELEDLRERERLLEKERQRNIEKLRELEGLKERQKHMEIERHQDVEKLKELEKLRERERLREMEKRPHENLKELKELRERERLGEIENSWENESLDELEVLREREETEKRYGIQCRGSKPLSENSHENASLKELVELRERERLRNSKKHQEFENRKELEELRERERLIEIEKSKEDKSLRELEELRERERAYEMEKHKEMQLRGSERLLETPNNHEHASLKELVELREKERLRNAEKRQELENCKELEELRERERISQLEKNYEKSLKKFQEIESRLQFESPQRVENLQSSGSPQRLIPQLQIHDLTMRMTELENIMMSVEDNSKAQVESVTARLHTKTSEAAAIKLENERLKTSLVTIEDKLTQADSEVAQLRGNLRQYETLIDEYRNQHSTQSHGQPVSPSASYARSVMNKSRREADETMTALDQQKSENKRLEHESETELEKVKNRLQSRLIELEPIPELLKSTELRLHDANEKIYSFDRRNTENTKLIAELTAKVETQADQIGHLHEKLHNAQDEGRNTHTRFESTERKLRDLEEQNRELLKTVAKREEAIHQANIRVDEKTRENAALNRQLESLLSDARRVNEGARDKAAAKDRTTQSRILDLEAQLSQSRAEIARIKREKDEAERKFNSRLYDVKDRLEQAHSTNRSMQNYVQFLKNSYANVFGDTSVATSSPMRSTFY